VAYCSTLKMNAVDSSDTSVDIHRTTRYYIPDDSTLQGDLWSRGLDHLLVLTYMVGVPCELGTRLVLLVTPGCLLFSNHLVLVCEECAQPPYLPYI
jgi:hypothetical protein